MGLKDNASEPGGRRRTIALWGAPRMAFSPAVSNGFSVTECVCGRAATRRLSIAPRTAFWLVTLACLGIFAIRILGPSDLMDNDQQRPAAYALDAMANGHWVVQHDPSGAVMSKPPLSTWITAALAAPFGELNLFLLYLPCLLATLGTAWIILSAGSRRFGRMAGTLAALTFLFSPVGFKQIALARTDTIFAFTVFASAMLAWRCWLRHSGWWSFWTVAALATLTKGPLGLVLAAGGLGAMRWEGGILESVHSRRAGHKIGILIFLALTAGWLALAWAMTGREVIDRMIFRELIGHAAGGGDGFSVDSLYKPTFYCLSRFAPWSILAAGGLIRIWIRPAFDPMERRFERFLTSYFLFGLILFSISSHHRADLIWPLIPAAALLAGRELDCLLCASGRIQFKYAAFGLASLLVGGFGLHSFFSGREAAVHETSRTREFAASLRAQVGNGFPFIFTKTNHAIQFHLNTMRPQLSEEIAAKALAGEGAAFVLTRKPEKIEELASGATLYRLAHYQEKDDRALYLIGNRPVLDYYPAMTAFAGDVMVEMDGLHWRPSPYDRPVFWGRSPRASLRLTNCAGTPRTLEMSFLNLPGADPERILTLAPGETQTLKLGQARPAGETVTFGHIADCRQSYAQMDWLAREKAFAGLDFLIVNGDFVYERQWRFDQFLEQASRLGVQIIPACGNHDIVKKSPYPYEAFQNAFGYTHTFFDSGDYRFAVIETGLKVIGERQFEFLNETFDDPSRPAKALLFQHVPPAALSTKRPDRFGHKIEPGEGKRILETAALAGVERIYAGHRNELTRRTEPTIHGPVGITVAGVGGEKSNIKDYRQQWLRIEAGPGGAVETAVDIADPPKSDRVWAHIVHRDAFLVRRYAPMALVQGLLCLMLVFGGRCALRSIAPDDRLS